MRIDLHAHSRHSDGTDTPAELVSAAAAGDLDVVALSDHDVTSGWAEAGAQGERLGVAVVPGVEISCAWRGISVHLLAYLLDPAHVGLRAEMDASRQQRETRLERMANALAADGFPVNWQELRAAVPQGSTLGRPHLADALVAAGRYPDRAAAFGDVLHRDSPYYVSHYAPDPATAAELVRAAGGVPVLAHPFAAARGKVIPESVIDELVDAGLAGLEVDHRDHPPQARQRLRVLAMRHRLLVTGSSDYHGAGKPNRLGENRTTPEVLRKILEAGSGSPMLGAPLG